MFVLALNVFTIHAVLAAEAVPVVALTADVADGPAHAPPARRLYSGLCRRERVMGCKQGCKRGWRHIKTIGWGCCKSWSSCGGNQKVCEQYYNCRRRNEDEESDNTTEDNNKFIGMMEEEFGDEIDAVTSSEQASPVQAGLLESTSTFEVEQISPEPEVISTSEEKDTKHFVMEDGEWVQLSQVEAKAMIASVSEDAYVEFSESVSEDDRRRRPFLPSWIKICKDEKEMPCNMPCLGGWSLVDEIKNGCCMRGPGSPGQPGNCGFTTKVCKKVYLCRA